MPGLGPLITIAVLLEKLILTPEAVKSSPAVQEVLETSKLESLVLYTLLTLNNGNACTFFFFSFYLLLFFTVMFVYLRSMSSFPIYIDRFICLACVLKEDHIPFHVWFVLGMI